MVNKKNSERTIERFKTWWDGELLDRCLASVTVSEKIPSDLVEKFRLPKNEEAILKYWTDPEFIIERERMRIEHTWYGGDALPSISLNLGAAGHAGFFRGEKHSFADTVWFHPTIENLDELVFDERMFLYQKTLEIAKALAEDSKGDYFVTMPDCSGNIDVLSHLMGAEEVMYRMIDNPEEVHRAMKKVQYAYERIHEDTYQIVKEVNHGGCGIGWLQTWAPGLHAQLQSDMSVMFSGDMFKEFIEPEIIAQSNFLDYSLYHLDGMEQIRHLDSLLSVKNLNAIQWMQCDNQPPCTAFFPELKKIQKAGKNIVMMIKPEQIEPVMENLSSKGLYLILQADSKEEGETMLKKIEKLTHE